MEIAKTKQAQVLARFKNGQVASEGERALATTESRDEEGIARRNKNSPVTTPGYSVGGNLKYETSLLTPLAFSV
jgi:hypothetical protein